MTILYFDCFSGASGDMILGALVDAGVPLGEVRRALHGLVPEEAIWTERVVRAGVSATKFQVRGEDATHSHAPGHDHDHDHDHTHHPHAPGPVDVAEPPSRKLDSHAHVHAGHGHRTLAEICHLIDHAALRHEGKERAKALFHRLAEAESAIHGTPMDRVHLHEVGALDSIVDIVGAVFAIDWLGVDRVVASPLNVGGGTIRSAHGLYPVPAPATVRLLTGAPIYAGAQQVELVTPTGALLITGYAERFGPVPPMRVRSIGYGAGTREVADTPNVLRVVIGDDDGDAQAQSVVVIEAEIDDMNPQIFGLLMDRLLAEGAVDVYYTPIQMKKNRPGTLLTVIAPPALRDKLTAVVFRESTTIGVRHREMLRECLERHVIEVETPLGPAQVKVASRGDARLNVSPEFDDCVRLAARHGLPVKDVQAIVMKAYLETQN